VNDSLRKLNSQLINCRSVKQQELDNFYAKRARYRKLLVWAGNSKFADQLQATIDAIRERDVLLTPKADHASACVASLGDAAYAAEEADNGGSCQALVSSGKEQFNKLRVQLSSCQACGLADVGHGYNKSPVEILVAQEKDARVLREALYNELVSGSGGPQGNGRFAMFNRWQMTRDVFISYVTDKTVEMPKAAKLNAMLQHLEKKLLTSDAPDQTTNNVIVAYQQLEATLQSTSSNRSKEAKRLLETCQKAIPELNVSGDTQRYTGFNDASDMAHSINSMTAQERNTLATAIRTAVDQYKKLGTS